DLRAQYRHALGSDGTSIGAFAGLTAAPGMLRPSLGLEVQPLAFLSLGVAYAATTHFGFLGVRSYSSPLADYGSGVLSSPPDGPSGRHSLVVPQLGGTAVLQGLIGPFAARNVTRAVRFFADLPAGDSVFYDPGLDVAVYKSGWAGQNETDVL